MVRRGPLSLKETCRVNNNRTVLPFPEATPSSLSALSAWVDGELPTQDWDASWQEVCEGR